MSRTMIRVVAAVLVLSTLALPLTAQPEPGRAPSLSLLAQLWHRITVPVMALFTAADSHGRQSFDPNGLTTDIREGFDPNGLDSDGRSAWDPNG
jgi:hypothetical protein